MEEELSMLEAIFGERLCTYTDEDAVRASVRIDREGQAPISVTFTLPDGYPSTTPNVEFEGLPKGSRDRVVAAVRSHMVAHVCDPVMFGVVQIVQDMFGDDHTHDADRAIAAEAEAGAAAAAAPIAHPAAARGITIIHGDPCVVMKSTFQAHVARVTSAEDVQAVIDELYMDRRIVAATHNIRAYRLVAGDGRVSADNDDDGEDAAGARLAHLLEMMRVENAVVVVSRWFGGVLMGPARFKVINDVARTLLEAQPWYEGRAGTGKR